MYQKRMSYTHVPSHLRDTALWPAIDLSLYPEGVQREVELLKKGITLYLRTAELAPALKEANCSKYKLYSKLARCLTPHGNEAGIVGWIALVPYRLVNPRLGTFERWLQEHEKSRVLLHRLILTGDGASGTRSRRPTAKGVTRAFLRHIKATVRQDTYPHDGTDVSRTIQRYIKDFIAVHPETTAVWFGEEVAKRQGLGSGRHSFDLADAPFSVFAADGHKIDAKGVVFIQGPAGRVPIEVERMQVFIIFAERVRAVVGYGICLEREISARHIEEAFVFANTPWKKKQLALEGVKYHAQAGFPNGCIDGISEVNPDLLKLDNWSAHFAKGVQQRLRESLGCAVSWGAIGHWWRNAVIERLNGELARRGFQRLPSSTGNGPQDPLKGNPSAEAARYGIDIEELMQLLDVLLANLNASPKKALGGLTPLEALRSLMETTSWVPRVRPPPTAAVAPLGVEVIQRKIAGSVKNRKAPYVEIDGQLYRSEKLSPRYDLIGCKVLVHVPQDMRTVEAYLDSGEYFGSLQIEDRGWRKSAHDRSIRKAINSLIYKRQLIVPAEADPIVCYLQLLATQTRSTAKGKSTRQTVTLASRLAEVQRVTGTYLPEPLLDADAANTPFYEGARTALPIRMPKGW